MEKEKEFIGTKEAAEMLQISTQTLYQYVYKGKLKSYKPAGKIYFKITEIMEFLNGSNK